MWSREGGKRKWTFDDASGCAVHYRRSCRKFKKATFMPQTTVKILISVYQYRLVSRFVSSWLYPSSFPYDDFHFRWVRAVVGKAKIPDRPDACANTFLRVKNLPCQALPVWLVVKFWVLGLVRSDQEIRLFLTVPSLSSSSFGPWTLRFLWLLCITTCSAPPPAWRCATNHIVVSLVYRRIHPWYRIQRSRALLIIYLDNHQLSSTRCSSQCITGVEHISRIAGRTIVRWWEWGP